MLNKVQKEEIKEFLLFCCCGGAFLLGMLALFVIPIYFFGEVAGGMIGMILGVIIVSVITVGVKRDP